ncbi:hypothetical protein [Verrucomicrobium spinosum]|uniref:hypothetical protein n=1 Tax=Verrucomicrobium spinosum TaxID=2736 RepID=UPI00094683D7|nr:hypothetical protein [Verrucomicrobium spinosum]
MYDTTTGTNTTLWNSPANSPATNPNSPSGNVAIVDRGAAGKDVYFMTGNGGASGSGFGTIQRYNTATGLTTTVHEFTGGATQGRQPLRASPRWATSSTSIPSLEEMPPPRAKPPPQETVPARFPFWM